MLRKAIAVLAFAFAVPSVALACKDETKAKAPESPQGEQLANKTSANKEPAAKKQAPQKNQ